jgi:hypothetical protein
MWRREEDATLAMREWRRRCASERAMRWARRATRDGNRGFHKNLTTVTSAAPVQIRPRSHLRVWILGHPQVSSEPSEE